MELSQAEENHVIITGYAEMVSIIRLSIKVTTTVGELVPAPKQQLVMVNDYDSHYPVAELKHAIITAV